ncbi:MAG: zinc ribbon domain-containing protein [Phycisphaerae bacterium]|nr:zinc ribbon domain-containing protein [Phycisphaerae bacterium]
MPTYDYHCQECGHKFEHFQSITAKLLRKCPECGKRTLQRLIGTGGGIIFKGSGFYQTDYRSESYKKAAEDEKKTSSSNESKDSGSKSAEQTVTTSETKKTTTSESSPRGKSRKRVAANV